MKNSIFRIAAKEAGVADLNGSLDGPDGGRDRQTGHLRRREGRQELRAEFDKLKVKFGYLNNQRLEDADIVALADLPSIEVLRAKLLGLLQTPGHEAGRAAQHAGQPAGPRPPGQGEKQRKRGLIRTCIKPFHLGRCLPTGSGETKQTTTVNRRFAGCELEMRRSSGRDGDDRLKGNMARHKQTS